MPIRSFLDGHKFDPENRVMGLAFELTREALRLADRTDPVLSANWLGPSPFASLGPLRTRAAGCGLTGLRCAFRYTMRSG
jgi:hypothetical protein